MGFLTEANNGPKCKMCQRIVIRRVPLYDKDQKHTGIQCCRDCKKLVRAGEDIVKFKFDGYSVLKILEAAKNGTYS